MSAFYTLPSQKGYYQKKSPSLKLWSSIDFGGVVTNAGADGVLITTVELEAEVLSDWDSRRENSRDKNDAGARLATVVAETMEQKVK